MTALETQIPARLDRLPWCRWHALIVLALGVTWVLDGLEVTLAGALGSVLKNPIALGLSDAQVGASASAYLAGAVLGALIFGYLTDIFGRKKLFFFTLALYLLATALSGLSWNFASYAFFRALTGAGIGGEYAAINSAIDELIPAKYRGQVDLSINATFWLGAIVGSVICLVFLNPEVVTPTLGWRLVYLFGAGLGLVMIFMRRWVPESPRWLVTHGRAEEAEKILDEVEQRIEQQGLILPALTESTQMKVQHGLAWREILHLVLHRHRKRSILCLVLMGSQAFFYNGIFFTYALVLTTFYGVSDTKVGWFIFPLAVGNLLGPILLGRLFDTVGRKPMIVATYALSGILLLLTSWLFKESLLSADSQALAWGITFFIASAAASAAYLTVSELFPLEIRGFAIAIFYAAGTLIGGVGAPALFGWLIGMKSRDALFMGYLLGAVLMIIAAIVEAIIGVKAERKSLEVIAHPMG